MEQEKSNHNGLGCIDKSGSIVIEAKYDYLSVFYDSLAVMRIGEKYGYIDKKGNIVIKQKFGWASFFSHEVAAVKTIDGYAYINKSGDIVIDKLDWVTNFSEGLGLIRKGKKWGFIDNKGNIVIIYTGFGDKRGFNEEYLFHPPWLDLSGAKYLVEKKVKGIGIDHFSLSGTTMEQSFPSHKEILGKNVWILEDLYIDKNILKEKNWTLIVMPMLIRGASGAPTRVLAVKI